MGPMYFWLAACILFSVVEAATVSLTSIWFAVGALVSLIAALLGAEVWLQVALFLLASAVSLALTRPLAKKLLGKRRVPTNTDRILDRLEQDFNFLPYAPVLITSSATGQNVTKLFELATEIDATRHLEIKTSDLNKILGEALLEHPPAGLKNTRPKLKYIVQTDTCPPWFVVHGRDLGLLHWSYKRFLERKVREHYPFVGTPIYFSFRSDDRE